MEDRTNEILNIYDKTGKIVATGIKGATTAAITELSAGTVVNAGDYKVSFTDATSKIESEKIDVPVFTVLLATDAPSEVKTTATKDGATISVE
ncbi:hypothetical protein M5C72_02770 [Companilactobacillus allii]|uniref:Uncharacterized protein n=1 Tax=Companilactobacillus allii TaxID=1847728 RepID=A0A1P8Q2M2_9LACO|nr:hypothetical protein [Companilactobacillus allii]APX72085.1 hypothetical protein BTM29_05685 [Companilactobacillus allii]USQ69178.1 hypothetical protein M5C72_02770 [Companilactobacillus allii]